MKTAEQGSAGVGVPDVLLQLRNISKTFGKEIAVKPLDLEIRRGDFFAILGPSGCGKTTILRIIGGFIAPTTGEVEIEGRTVTHLGPEKRPTNMVFQGYGLFPHMTVRQNIAYGLRIAKTTRAEIDRRVAETVELVRLGDLQDRRVNELSGGQQQRVAVARALIMRPPVLLLDEPLAALDLKLRQAMQEELRRIHHEIGGTFVFVTHDQGEAMSLANRIAVMHAGELIQVSSPEEIYRNPKTPFVATFVGDANIFPGHRREGIVELQIGERFANAGVDGAVLVVVRPEAMTLEDKPIDGFLSAAGRIVNIVFMGSYVRYGVELSCGDMVVVQDSSDCRRADLKEGIAIRVAWDRSTQMVLAS
jgi:spermidine/putrescine transport system ATP-binding protein